MRRAHIRGALVGVESVTPEGLKAVFKNFNDAGEALVERLQAFRTHDIHILGSFIFGLPTDKAEYLSRDCRSRPASGRDLRAVRHADAVPGTLDFAKWEKEVGSGVQQIDGVPLTRYWLVPPASDRRCIYPTRRCPTMKSVGAHSTPGTSSTRSA